MSVQKMMVNSVDQDGNWLYRVGGISALVLGVAYIIIIVLYVPLGAPPSGGEARLAYIAENSTAWWAILGLSVLTDFLFVPMVYGLGTCLGKSHHHYGIKPFITAVVDECCERMIP